MRAARPREHAGGEPPIATAHAAMGLNVYYDTLNRCMNACSSPRLAAPKPSGSSRREALFAHESADKQLTLLLSAGLCQASYGGPTAWQAGVVIAGDDGK